MEGNVKRLMDLPLKSIYTIGQGETKSGFEVYYLFEYKSGNFSEKADNVYMVYATTVLGEWLTENFEKLKKAIFELEIEFRDSQYNKKIAVPVRVKKIADKPKVPVQVQEEGF